MTERGIAASLVATKLGIHLALFGRYGYHRDELYFIECGRHLAFGYVDHAPLVPWLSRLIGAVSDHSLLALRLPAALAGALTVWLTLLATRRLGGGRYAQLLAGICIVVAPAYLRMGIMLNIVVFEPLLWTLGSYLVIRLLQGADPRLWLLVGAVGGVGLLTKHTMLVWGAGLVVGLLLTSGRELLRSPWPWAGGALALALFAPNLAWQATHGWATVEFLSAMSTGTLAGIPRTLFLLGQLLYLHPIAALVWVPGLLWLFSSDGHRYRLLGWSFLAMLTIFLLTHAKPYYLAPAYPVLLAAGGVALERRLAAWNRLRAALLATVAATGVALGVLTLPILPLQRADAVIDALFGRVVPAIALTHDLHDEYGWRELTVRVADLYGGLPPGDRQGAAIVTGNYGQASAINFFGRDLGLPHAVSGHMTYHLWGPPARVDGPLIAVGLTSRELAALCPDPQRAPAFSHPLAMEDGTALALCSAPAPLAPAWPRLKRYRHGSAELEPATAGGS